MNRYLPSSHLSSIFIIFLILGLGINLAACSAAPQPASTSPTAPPTQAATATLPLAATNTPQLEAVETPQNLQQSTAAAPTPTEATDSEETATKEASDTETTPISGDAQAGQHRFAEVCAPCHGLDGKGIEGIGLDLTTSKFAGDLTLTQLADFIAMGRSLNNQFNFTGIKMPPKGGRPDLSDEDLLNIAAYLHSINTQTGNESSEAAEYLAWVESGGAEEIETTPEVSQAGLSGAALEGQTTYFRFCAVCHGPRGEGVKSLGKSLANSDFVSSLSDDELIQFLGAGRPVDDPLNTTGIEMLPYGGQKSLTADELSNLVAYLRVVDTGEVTLAAKPSDVEADEVAEAQDAQEINEALEEETFAIIDGLAPKCFVCHLIVERGNPNGPGPHLNDIGSQAGNRIPGVNAEAYIRQSILSPDAFIVEECPAGPCVDAMPKNFGDQLSEAQLNMLVEFLLSLKSEE